MLISLTQFKLVNAKAMLTLKEVYFHELFPSKQVDMLSFTKKNAKQETEILK